MGCKMIKGNGLALLILIFIFIMVPVSCDNNSSNSSPQFDFASNASGLNQTSSNISETKETAPSDNSKLDLIDKYIKVILGIFALIAIPIGLIRWLLPDTEKRLRIRIRGILGKNEHIESDLEEPINPGPEKESPKNTIKLPLPNPNFTGRQNFLSALAQPLLKATTSPKIFALVGNGGMGKTQIALQHAHNPENKFKYVWWLRSEEPATLLEDYISIARDLHLPGWDLRDTDQTVKTVKLWLEAECNSSWLLVFDNAQKPEDLERYIPVAGSGQVILTSRQSIWDGMAETLEVKVFQRNKMEGESVDFLLKRTGKNDRKGAADLAQELGDLPLALEQAGAYIKESGISFADYLVRLKKNRKELLSKGKPLNYSDSVATTWEISFRAVQEENPATGDLLRLFAFLAPDAIPRGLLEEGVKHLPEPLSSCVRNSQQLDGCISILNRYSLISAADNLFSIHRLVQAVVQDRLSLEEQKIWAESALKMVNDAFSFDQFDEDSWEKCSRLSSHAINASENAEKLEVSLQDTSHLLNAIGGYLHNQMELASARSLFERALAIDEKTVGPKHIRVAIALNNLGLVLRDLGSLDSAKKCLESALDIDEKALNPEHTSIARDVNNLGLVLQALGDLVGAKKCFKRAFDINKNILGNEHITVALNANNLGMVLKDQGELLSAKECFEKALAIDEKTLGAEHTSVARDVNNLGLVLQALGDLVGAKNCFKRAFDINENILGAEHPTVAVNANNIGVVLKDLGDLEGARKCLMKALGIDEKTLGAKHTSVARDVNNLGLVLMAQHNLDGAKLCYERALAIDEKALGPEHANVANYVNNLGSVLKAQLDLKGAKRCFERALEIDEKALGPEHASVAVRINNLGVLLKDQGDLEEAKKCFERALVILEKKLGKDHPTTLLVRKNLKSM